jgi:hypothetical protein
MTTISTQIAAVDRALKVAPTRTSADLLQRTYLSAVMATLQSLSGLTQEQIEFASTERGKALIRAAWDARDKSVVTETA